MANERFYRIHRPELPTLCAANAYSAEWGSSFVSPSEIRCEICSGEGEFDDDIKCAACDGTGIKEADRGYSCCKSIEQLSAYFASRGGVDLNNVTIYEFAASVEACSVYGSNELLVVPVDSTIRQLDEAEWRPTFTVAAGVALS